ncbi:MAG: beta-ketoacyl synthase chain length factor [Holophagales bacterium]|nr:beta-ketoacyl synthase chain length factor [Holophagales bacterium]
MSVRPEVVVTGVGAVGAQGVGVEAIVEALASGGAPAVEVDRSAGYHRGHGARTARLAAGLDLSALVPPRQARRMSPPARYAAAAAKLALDRAGLDDPTAHARTAVVVGTAFGPSSVTEQLLRQILRLGPDQASPAAFTESVASAAASQVALLWKARGPSLAITQREASDLLALGEGARLLEHGRADRVLVLVVEEMIPLLHAVLDRFRALALPEAGGREVARPFERGRSGVIAAEGGAALLLERRDAVEARGARPLARVAARVAAFDPTAPAHDWGEGADRLAATLAAGLGRQGVGLGSIDRIVSGASGSRRGDALEARTLAALYADRDLPPVHAPKGALGEYGGGFLAAAVEIAAGATAGNADALHAPDTDLPLEPRAERAPSPPRRTLVTALATSGAGAWAVLDPA